MFSPSVSLQYDRAYLSQEDAIRLNLQLGQTVCTAQPNVRSVVCCCSGVNFGTLSKRYLFVSFLLIHLTVFGVSVPLNS